MNIKQAKEELTNTLRAYLAKDELGNYLIPANRQRPVLLMGPPGIGKTQIMEQIAAETGVGLVSYTITHHTRQSAVGLPFIEKRTYGGREFSVTEYTMSEILASVYDLMEQTGLREGILFLDELPEFSRRTLEALREPLETGRVVIARALRSTQFPARFQLVAAMNPCPCGWRGHPGRACACTPAVSARMSCNSRPSSEMLRALAMACE